MEEMFRGEPEIEEGPLSVNQFSERVLEAVGKGASLNRACALHKAIGQGVGVDFLQVLLQHGCVFLVKTLRIGIQLYLEFRFN